VTRLPRQAAPVENHLTVAEVRSQRKRTRRMSRANQSGGRREADATIPADERLDPLLSRTLDVWQPRSSRQLNREDARCTVDNTTGFFRLLDEWAQAEDRKT
jgi:hypothetical protein